MKKLLVILATLGLGSILVTSCKGKAPEEKPGKVLAEVNGIKITEADFAAELEGKPDFYKQYAQSADGKKQIRDKLVERKLLLLTAEKEGVANSPDLEAKVQAYRERMIVDKLREKVVATQFEITDEDTKDYYDSHPEQYNRPESARLRQIVVNDAKTADTVYKEAKASPAQFEELARKYSQDETTKGRGGEMGMVNKGTQAPEVESKIFSLKEGEISSPVNSKGKFYIFQMVQKKPAENKDYDQVKDQIKKRMDYEKKQDQWKEYLDNLKKTAQIKYME